MTEFKMRIREGCRGGQEQFQWKSVQNEDFKDREMYLGQATKVGVMGKFGKYYKHDWYQKKRDTPESIQSEMGTVKAYEEELMQEALGLKPKKLLLAKRQLDEEDLKVFLARDGAKPEGKKGRDQMGGQGKLVTNEFGEQVAERDEVGTAYIEAGVKGIGYASHRTARLEEYKAKAFGTTSTLDGGKGELGLIKVEDDDVKMSFGLKHELKSEVKTEVKTELKAEVKTEAEDDGAELKDEEKGELKAELKAEGHDVKRAIKDEADEEEQKRRKTEKDDKEEFKTKKAKKKLKKLDKKLKKAKKKEKKAAKKVKKEHKKELKKAQKKGSSSSSSSDS